MVDPLIDKLVIAMPAFNEESGIGEFVAEIIAAVSPSTQQLRIIVADDASTDTTVAALESLSEPGLRIASESVNRGHGPTALRAYHEALTEDADLVVHVDGDGQFYGADIARIVRAAAQTNADVIHGVRVGRSDPWFRRTLSFALRVATSVAAGHPIPDPNTPLRAYRPSTLRALLSEVDSDSLVPHVHFSLTEVRRSASVRYVAVRSLPRRGGDANGTMFGGGRVRLLPPASLLRFAVRALAEMWRRWTRPLHGSPSIARRASR